MDVKSEIKRLARERDAVILAHNYQIDEIQEIADFTGDSLGLSIEASRVKIRLLCFVVSILWQRLPIPYLPRKLCYSLKKMQAVLWQTWSLLRA